MKEDVFRIRIANADRMRMFTGSIPAEKSGLFIKTALIRMANASIPILNLRSVGASNIGKGFYAKQT